jgi:hypothetical protein
MKKTALILAFAVAILTVPAGLAQSTGGAGSAGGAAGRAERHPRPDAQRGDWLVWTISLPRV